MFFIFFFFFCFFFRLKSSISITETPTSMKICVYTYFLTRPGCTIRVMCSVTVEVRAVLTEELYTESGSAGVLSSVRCCYNTECEETGHLLPTSGGGGWCRSHTRPLLLEVKKYVVVLFSFWLDVQYTLCAM